MEEKILYKDKNVYSREMLKNSFKTNRKHFMRTRIITEIKDENVVQIGKMEDTPVADKSIIKKFMKERCFYAIYEII